MTTNTTSTASQAPAVSIDTPEFRRMLHLFKDFEAMPTEAQIIAHIDAKLAQVAQDKTDFANQMIEDCRKLRDRATAAEAKLKTIRGTVKSLVGYGDEHASFISRANVLALFEQRSETDESGLPG